MFPIFRASDVDDAFPSNALHIKCLVSLRFNILALKHLKGAHSENDALVLKQGKQQKQHREISVSTNPAAIAHLFDTAPDLHSPREVGILASDHL